MSEKIELEYVLFDHGIYCEKLGRKDTFSTLQGVPKQAVFVSSIIGDGTCVSFVIDDHKVLVPYARVLDMRELADLRRIEQVKKIEAPAIMQDETTPVADISKRKGRPRKAAPGE